ncbi:MAG: hypothetical protein EBS84_01830 [Proteobacteria bacterium]|nr:hypothetical protein [Pseudomonadota bacterium]
MELDFRVRQEDVADGHAEVYLGDVANLLLRLLPVTRLALVELRNQPPEQRERLHVILLLRPVAVLERDGAALVHHPFGVVIQRVIIPIRPFAGLERRLEMLRHPRARIPVTAVILERHREEIMRVGLVVLRGGYLQHVLENVQRDDVAVVPVAVIRLRLRRLGGAPYDAEVTRPRLLRRPLPGPPVQHLRVMLPRRAPVALVARRPVRVSE